MHGMVPDHKQSSHDTDLHKTNGNIHGNASASLWTLIVGNWPWIALQIFNDRGEDKLTILYRQQESII
jgi:hypothetical protein